MRQNPHVRICGGPGSATTLVYPTPSGRGARRLDRDLCGGRLQPRANADLGGDVPLTASVNGGASTKRFTSERERVEHLFALYERTRAPLTAEAAVKHRGRRRLRIR